MFNFSMTEVVVILLVVLLVFGPSKLPEVGKAFGRSIREFKDATSEAKEEPGKTALLDATAKDQTNK